MSATETAVGAVPVGGPAGRRGQTVRVLDALLEAALCGLVAAPVLLQSTRLTDNLLGKSGATLILAGLVVMLWVAASVARQGTLVLRRSRADLPFGALLAISVAALSSPPELEGTAASRSSAAAARMRSPEPKAEPKTGSRPHCCDLSV